MSRMNDDLNTIIPGHDANKARREPKDGEMAKDGYETVDRADPGRARKGMAPSTHSYEGMDVYRPRGR